MNKVYIAAHKPFTPPDNDLYIPIQVNAQHNPVFTSVTDHTGDNISEKNYLYGELTALYWIWKNETEASYLGLCHYHRYFLNEQQQLLSTLDIDRLLSEADILLPYKTFCPGMNYYEMFAASHSINDLKIIEDIIARIKPEYLPDYQQAIYSGVYYTGNLFITSRKLFCQYAKWLFDIFNEAEKFIDVSGYDPYHRRVYGFLSEQMLMAWVNHHRLRICELKVAITSEKIETAETLSTLSDYLAKEDVDGAIAYYTSFLRQRPDIRFREADINGALPYLELALDIWKSEANQNLSGIRNYRSDLSELLFFVRHSCQKVALALSNNVSAVAWLAENNVTWVMVERILEHEKPDKKTLISNINKIAMLFHSISCDLECLQLIQYAIRLDPEDSASLRHSAIVCSEISGNRYPMNIAIATNRKYVPISLVCLYSLFFNNPDADIHVYILNCELNDDDALRFQQLATAWNQKITLVTVTDMTLFTNLPTTDSWTKETYFRLLIPNLLPLEVERILYLDVDTIINKSIREFYEMDFAEMDFVVCEDIMLNRVYKAYYKENFAEMREKEFTYFNAGVMLWNLSQIREHYTFEMYCAKITEYLPVLQCLDQDILNAMHCGKTITADWRKYNLLIPTAIQNHFSVEDVKNISCIIHFLGPKPWDPAVEFQALYQIWNDYNELANSDDLS